MLKTVCVLGGSGFVGRHLVGALAKAGYQIKLFTRKRDKHKELFVIPSVSFVEGDIYDGVFLEREFQGAYAVINLVGILNEKGHNGRGFHRSHVELAVKVASSCIHAGVNRLLHMSSLNANAKLGTSYYLRSKGEAEDRVHAMASEGLEVTSFRPSVIFGFDDSFFNRFASLIKLSPVFFPLACAQAKLSPVYVGDVVACFLHSLQDKATIGQRYDLCGPKVYTLQQIIEYTARMLDKSRMVIPLPNFIAALQAFVFEFVPGKPFSRDNFHSLKTDSVCQSSFPQIFGIKPTPVDAIVPSYLQNNHQRGHYRQYRSGAGRK